MLTNLIRDVRCHFINFYDITLALQTKGTNLAFVRSAFDVLLADDEYSCMGKYLDQSADIVCSPVFEAGVIKLTTGVMLTANEAEAMKLFKKQLLVGESEEAELVEERVSTADRLKLLLQSNKKQKTSDNDNEHPHSKTYMDVSQLVCATSNCCERLFSEAKYIMLPHRRGTSPILFEALLFLKKNLEYWNVATVSVAMRAAAVANDLEDPEGI